MMADSAFKVLVLPRGEQADISQFGAELQKICDQVNTANGLPYCNDYS